MIPQHLRPTVTKKRLLMERARRSYDQQAARIEQEIALLQQELVRILQPLLDAEREYYDTAQALGYCGFCESALDVCCCPPPITLAESASAHVS